MIKIKSTVPIEKLLKQEVQKVHKDLYYCLMNLGSDIHDASVAAVSVKTGTLRSSGYFEGDGINNVYIGFADNAHDRLNPSTGKYASDYAMEVHEVGSINQSTQQYASGPQKYLTVPANIILRDWASYFDTQPVKCSGMELVEVFDDDNIPF